MPLSVSDALYGQLVDLGYQGSISDLQLAFLSDDNPPGGGSSGGSEGNAALSGPAVIGVIGASISSNGTLSNYDRALSGCVSLGGLSYLAYALPLTQGKFCMGGIAATPGFTSQQMIDTHLPSVLASNWDFVIVGEFTNDYGNGVSLTQSKANHKIVVDAIVAAGKTPILVTLNPTDTSAGTPAEYTWITKFNAYIKAEATRRKVPFVDYHTVLSNPSTGAYIAGYASDGLHPTSVGAYVMGLELARVLNSIPCSSIQPLAGSYNPNYLIPDVVQSSAGADKAVGLGNTTGGWGLKSQSHAKYWKGSAFIVTRGSAGDYSYRYPVDSSKWIEGHRVRLAFGLDVSNIPNLGGYSANLYNVTDLQVIAGLTGVVFGGTNNSLTVADAAITNGSNQVTSASKLFRPEHIGHAASACAGVVASIPAGTTVIGVSADGGTAYLSANASVTQAVSILTLSGKPVVAVFEFTVQANMVGKDIRFYITASGAQNTTVSLTQLTCYDLNTLEVLS